MQKEFNILWETQVISRVIQPQIIVFDINTLTIMNSRT